MMPVSLKSKIIIVLKTGDREQRHRTEACSAEGVLTQMFLDSG